MSKLKSLHLARLSSSSYIGMIISKKVKKLILESLDSSIINVEHSQAFSRIDLVLTEHSRIIIDILRMKKQVNL
jgi:hypothetical protein